MTYYNQNDYAHIPYPAPGYEKATIKSGGCGVCCCSVILSRMGFTYPPEALAQMFIEKGARVSGGTDMNKAARIISDLCGINYRTTSLEAELTVHLQSGGYAIANVDGDVGEKGVFSNSGHYICIIGLAPEGRYIVYDVGDYPNKYKSAYRASHVKREGKLLTCTPETLHMDTKHRNPGYYLFSSPVKAESAENPPRQETGEPPSEWAEASWSKAVKSGVLEDKEPKSPLTREQLAVVLDRLNLIPKEDE